MEAWSFWISVAVLAASLALYGEVLRGWHRFRQLRDAAPILTPNPPAVSIVIAARNEASNLEPAIRSILALRYPTLEIIAVDDRSTDGTGEMLDALRSEFPGLRVIHVRELPPGWLGKNHALHCGAREARGTYLLFTDADVVYDPSAIARAVSHCEEHRLDHLTIIPDIPVRSAFMAMSMMGGFIGILALHRPWRARESGKTHIGVGAFNMVRASSYREAGGHEALAMEVLDDIELGRMMGERHLRQEMLLGQGLLTIEMYGSAMEMFRGIQKNVFAFLDYSTAKLLGATLVTVAFAVWPWAGALAAEGFTRWLNVASVATVTSLYLYLAPHFGYTRWCVIYLPFTGLIAIGLFWQIAIATWLRGGIVWRGTFYSLSDIRARRRMRHA